MDLSKYISKDNDTFYFDPEEITEEGVKVLPLIFENGDTIKWNWEGKKMLGKLQYISNNLFSLNNVRELN
jgi:hypothetical protein